MSVVFDPNSSIFVIFAVFLMILFILPFPFRQCGGGIIWAVEVGPWGGLTLSMIPGREECQKNTVKPNWGRLRRTSER